MRGSPEIYLRIVIVFFDPNPLIQFTERGHRGCVYWDKKYGTSILYISGASLHAWGNWIGATSHLPTSFELHRTHVSALYRPHHFYGSCLCIDVFHVTCIQHKCNLLQLYSRSL
ncbi:hypothetical protein L2E82_01592 [Cichorium intybus]|uniref:Uncharacterized protein n=1 Tax=Cichorium intybus TaxID=13427 RepID=A0ACB9GYZ7_CICIN|nr:hypothetical protein L2E82_01592 [Cichorium intybus]